MYRVRWESEANSALGWETRTLRHQPQLSVLRKMVTFNGHSKTDTSDSMRWPKRFARDLVSSLVDKGEFKEQPRSNKTQASRVSHALLYLVSSYPSPSTTQCSAVLLSLLRNHVLLLVFQLRGRIYSTSIACTHLDLSLNQCASTERIKDWSSIHQKYRSRKIPFQV